MVVASTISAILVFFVLWFSQKPETGILTTDH